MSNEILALLASFGRYSKSYQFKLIIASLHVVNRIISLMKDPDSSTNDTDSSTNDTTTTAHIV